MIGHPTVPVATAGLGLTQIVGYGTLYYSFAILAPGMAAEFRLSQEWIFAALSAALFAGSLVAPLAGRWADRYGAGRVMTYGSIAAAAALVLCALAPEPVSFVLALLAMELASCFVLYGAAFVAIVQLGGQQPQRSIVHLTLIAGFASTLFWPITSTLHATLTWREVYLVFAALNLMLCLPIHAWLMRVTRERGESSRQSGSSPPPTGTVPGLAPLASRVAFPLMLAGFALEGFVLSAVLIHMVPLTAALGLGTAGLAVATLFGPAQVASRLVNMVFGGRLPQTHLAVIAAGLLTLGLVVLLATTPWLPGGMIFVVLFGLGSGLTSIVSGTLPLELFGREGYGARLGWVSAARQVTSALAPFALAFMMARVPVTDAVKIAAAISGSGVLAFAAIAAIRHRSIGVSRV
ncbi:MAG TPA: arsenite efflux MFS transporter ArsK [Rhizobiales bacterium]|nr:arsenite efflux MFS transporter ArsK [Hyphomicrobiales bacterium]